MAQENVLSWLGGHLSHLFAASPEKKEAAPTSAVPEQPARAALEDLTRSLELLRGEEFAGEIHETEDQRKARLKAEREEAERLGAEKNQKDMLEDILALHARLGTGMDAAGLEAAEARARTFLEQIQKTLAQDALGAQVIGSVAVGVYLRVGEAAWDELAAMLAAAGLEWPDPPGLPPKADEEDRAHARELQHKRDRQEFLATKGVVALERMKGVVQVWRDTYPERGSSLWQATALRGVGFGLRVRLFCRALDQTEKRKEELRNALTERLQEKLSEVHTLLARGVTSIAEADRISRDAQRVVQVEAPELVWAAVKDQVLEPVGAR